MRARYVLIDLIISSCEEGSPCHEHKINKFYLQILRFEFEKTKPFFKSLQRKNVSINISPSSHYSSFMKKGDISAFGE